MAIYIFIDESGNLDFSENGSRYFLFGALSTRDPVPLTTALNELLYKLLADGLEMECFHATEDTQAVRTQVFGLLTDVGGFELDVLVADKRAMHPDLREPSEFYAYMAHILIDAVLRRHLTDDEPVTVVTDRIPLQRTRKAFEKVFKQGLREILGERKFSLVHHASAAHPGLQAADYCTWAVQRAWQRGDTRPYELVRDAVRSQWLANDGRLIGTIPVLGTPVEKPSTELIKVVTLKEKPAEMPLIVGAPAGETSVEAMSMSDVSIVETPVAAAVVEAVATEEVPADGKSG